MSFWAGVLLAPLIWYVATISVYAIVLGVRGIRQWREDREWRRLVAEFGVARAVEMHAERR